MEQEQLKEFEARLRARLEELSSQGDIKASPNRTAPVENVDEDAQPLNEMEQVIASRRNKERALEGERILGALQRLKSDPDAFGECQECGEEIAIRRMEIMPWALFCVRCQEARQGKRGYRRRHATDFID